MALIDDINALPTTVGDGQTGHLNNHQVIHAALKDHEVRLGARHFIGTGSPEGKITATIGTQYTDQAATNGAIRWIKTSGTGASGWRVEYGDTGWRNVISSVTDEPTGVFNILREGNRVWLDMEKVTVTPEGKLAAFQRFGNVIPVGFRPPRTFQYPAIGAWNSQEALGPVRIAAGGDLVVYGTTGKDFISGLVSFHTSNPWPTALPGIPA